MTDHDSSERSIGSFRSMSRSGSSAESELPDTGVSEEGSASETVCVPESDDLSDPADGWLPEQPLRVPMLTERIAVHSNRQRLLFFDRLNIRLL